MMPITEGISGVVTPKDKIMSNPIARLKLKIYLKSV